MELGGQEGWRTNGAGHILPKRGSSSASWCMASKV